MIENEIYCYVNEIYCYLWLYNNAIEEIISDTSKFEKVSEDPTLKHEASLQRFLCKLKQKNCFNKIEYDELHPSGSAPAHIYKTPKMHKFSSMIHFLNFVQLFHLKVLLLIILRVSFLIFFHL